MKRRDTVTPDHICGPDCTYRKLYEGSQRSLSDMAGRQAQAVARVGRLRNQVILVLKRAFPRAFSDAERAMGVRMSDTGDEVLVAYLESFLDGSAGSDTGGSLELLRSALHEIGVPVPPGYDLNDWATAVRQYAVNHRDPFATPTAPPPQPAGKPLGIPNRTLHAPTGGTDSSVGSVAVTGGPTSATNVDRDRGVTTPIEADTDTMSTTTGGAVAGGGIDDGGIDDLFSDTPLRDDLIGGDPLDGNPLDGNPLDGNPLDGNPIAGNPLDDDLFDGNPLDGNPLGDTPMSDDLFGDDLIGDSPLDSNILDGNTLGDDVFGDHPLEGDPQSTTRIVADASTVPEPDTPTDAGDAELDDLFAEQVDSTPAASTTHVDTTTEAAAASPDHTAPLPAWATGKAVKPQLFPPARPVTKRERRSPRVRALPADAPDVPVAEPAVLDASALNDAVRAQLLALASVPRPVFTADLIAAIGSEEVVDLWRQEWQDGDLTVRFVLPKPRHRLRGPLVVPQSALKSADTAFATSWWGRCMERYRGARLYELGVFFHRFADQVISFDDDRGVIAVRMALPQGLTGAILIADTQLGDGGATRDGLCDALERFLGDRLVHIAVLAMNAEQFEPAAEAVETAARTRQWRAGMPVTLSRSWEYVDGTGAAVPLLGV